jgi:glycosyl transferase family 87
VGRPGNGPRGRVGGRDPDALLPGDRDHEHRRAVAPAPSVAIAAAAAWLVAFLTWSAQPAAYDFIALYAAARLVATGRAGSVTDPDALLAAEHAAVPERTILLNDPNPPALALVMAPLGALPLPLAYALWSALGALALIAAAFFLGRLVPPAQRGRLFPFVLLAPTSLIALAEGQTTPFVLLAVAASIRAPALWSGALLGMTAFRPQLLPLFALAALGDRRRAVGLVAAVAAVAIVSLATVGVEGMARYPALLSLAATELRPGELGLVALARRLLGAENIALNAALGAIALLIAGAAVLLRSRLITSRLIDSSTWSLLAAPHALLHDGVMAYPAVAAAATTTRATVLWVGTGIAASLAHEAGLPVAPLWLLALFVWGRRFGGPPASSPAGATRP